MNTQRFVSITNSRDITPRYGQLLVASTIQFLGPCLVQFVLALETGARQRMVDHVRSTGVLQVVISTPHVSSVNH